MAEGTRVRVEPIAGVTKENDPLAALSRRLLDVAGTAKGLPDDLAQNHDHYLHGRPKQ